MKEYTIEVTIVRTAIIEAKDEGEAKSLAIEDIYESLGDTEIYPSDCKIVEINDQTPL